MSGDWGKFPQHDALLGRGRLKKGRVFAPRKGRRFPREAANAPRDGCEAVWSSASRSYATFAKLENNPIAAFQMAKVVLAGNLFANTLQIIVPAPAGRCVGRLKTLSAISSRQSTREPRPDVGEIVRCRPLRVVDRGDRRLLAGVPAFRLDKPRQ